MAAGFWEREGGVVPTSKESLKERLGRYREIRISVIGRKSGRRISIPVWFVVEGEKVYLLPVSGSETQWFKNVRKNPVIGIGARGAEGEFRATAVTGAEAVKSVVEKFREKYGAGDVKKYYAGFDVAVVVRVTEVRRRWVFAFRINSVAVGFGGVHPDLTVQP